MKENLQAADFAQYVDQKFSIKFSPAETVEAILTEVIESSPQTFSIIFKLSQASVAPQGIYTISHEELGVMSLFLVPISPENYEAVFNYIE